MGHRNDRRGGKKQAGFTLVELLVALGVAAGVALALAGVVWQAGRLGEGLGTREKGVWAGERALVEASRRVGCAFAPPGLGKEEKAFEMKGGGDGVTEPLWRVAFYAPSAEGVWDDLAVVERVGYEVWAGKGGTKEWRVMSAAVSGPGAGEWRTNGIWRGAFEWTAAVRAAPGEPGGKWGEWVEEWPDPNAAAQGEGEGEEGGSMVGAVPGAVRFEMGVGGARWVTETVVEASQPPVKLRKAAEGGGDD